MTKIVNKNLNDHQDLLFLLDEGLNLCEKLPKEVNWSGHGADKYNQDILIDFSYQMSLLSTVKELVMKNRYIESFIVLRSVFEHYFLYKLISNGIIYPQRIDIGKMSCSEFSEKADKLIQEGKIVNYEYHGRISILFRKGLKDKSNRIIPIYYFMYQNYDPIKRYVEPLFTFRSLDAISDITKALIEKQKDIHYYNNFQRGVKKGLLINEMVTQQEWDRIIVHYNFLSIFTHVCYKGIKEIEYERICPNMDSFEKLRKFDHYLSELILLYTLRLIEYYLKVILNNKNKTWSLSDANKIKSYLKKLEKKISYFWFIFEDPHEFDILKHEEDIWIYKKRKNYPPKKPINYYRDPLERLRKMHRSIQYLDIGKLYRTPFE